MKKIIYCFSICIWIANSSLYAQPNTIDSLKSLLKISNEDTSKVKNLIKLARKLKVKEPYIADSLNLIALNLSEKLKWEYGKAESFLNMGVSHFNNGNWQPAMEYYLKALSIYEKQNNAQRIADINGNIGSIYKKQKEYEKAIEYYLKTTEFYQDLGDKISIAYGYFNIGGCYHESGNSDKALDYYFKALPLVKIEKDTFIISLVLGNIANVYKDEKNDNALKYYLEALRYAELGRDKYSIARNQVNISDYYLKTKSYKDARQYAEKSMAVAKEIGYIEVLWSNYQILSALDSAERNFKGAFENYKLYTLYLDSINGIEKSKQMAELQTRYETEKKDNEIKMLDQQNKLKGVEADKQKNIRNTIVLLSLLIIISGAFAFYRFRQKAKQKQETERARISRDLHDDLGATLGSISIYSEVAKNKAAGNNDMNEVLEKIGDGSREMLDKMNDIVWAVNPKNDNAEELTLRMKNFAATMLTPRNIVFEFKNQSNGLTQLNLDMHMRKNIFLIYKEALHNIVKYADAKNVAVTLHAAAKNLDIKISDNGKGFNTHSFEEKRVYNGNGIKNMQARAKEINGKFEIQSEINKGTSIHVSVPV